jgi:small subunit ribosomal protein S6
MLRKYELTALLRINGELEATQSRVKEILQKYGVTVENDASWGSKRMAYEISGERDAHYMFLLIEAPTDSIVKIIAEFKLNTNILRYLFVVLNQKKSA